LQRLEDVANRAPPRGFWSEKIAKEVSSGRQVHWSLVKVASSELICALSVLNLKSLVSAVFVESVAIGWRGAVARLLEQVATWVAPRRRLRA